MPGSRYSQELGIARGALTPNAQLLFGEVKTAVLSVDLHLIDYKVKVFGAVNAKTEVVGEDDVDVYPFFQKPQLLKFFNLFQGAWRQRGKGSKS